MMVKALRVGNEVCGLRVGQSNVRRFFPRNITEIELQLDHLRIECGLPPGFWRADPEIHDPRLRLWLQSKNHEKPWNHEKPCRTSILFTMVPSGGNSFKLEPVTHNENHRARHSTMAIAGARFEGF
jgi:hypothetical protein